MPGIKNQKYKKIALQERIESLSDKEVVPFFVLTESHLKPYIKDAEVAIDQYSCLRADRRERPQGGVIIYYQQHLSVTKEASFSNDTCEVACVLLSQLNTIIVGIYRPPDTPFTIFQEALAMVDKFLNDADSCKRDIFIMGDMNLPNVDWQTEQTVTGCSKNDRECFEALEKVMIGHFLIQCVNKPTRQDNILDVILTNNEEQIRRIQTEETIMSDHNFVVCNLGFSTSATRESDYAREGFNALNLHKADWDAIIEELDLVEWSNLYEGADPTDDEDEASYFRMFTNKVLEICSNHAPARSKKRAKKKCEYRAQLRRRKKRRLQLERLQENNSGSPQIDKLKGELVEVELEIRDKIKGMLKDNEIEIIDQIKVNPKVFYAFANSFLKTIQRIGPLEKQGTKELITDPTEMANILAYQYIKSFSDPGVPIPEDVLNKEPVACSITDISFSAEDIEKAIDALQMYSATGPDDFPAIVLKKCKKQLSHPLYNLWRESLDSGHIPNYLLRQNIVPIYKKGPKTEAQNYRPVSLTSHLIKVFERVMKDALVTYLEVNDLISNQQHGFRKSKSCLTQLLAHVESILNIISSGSNADVIYLDFAKAFDKVSHTILIKKLENLGISGKVLAWLKCFLSNRYQAVTVEGMVSFFHLVLSGVPQGTVLGPLLFIIFINDIYDVVKHSLARSFADDTRLTKLIKCLADQLELQADLEAVTTWAVNNNMALHENKFELLQHGKDQNLKGEQSHLYQLSSGTTIEKCDTVKDLGVVIDESLSWSNHIKEVTRQSSQMSAWILRTFNTRSALPLMTLFKSLVRSRIDYCCPVWSPSTKQDVCAVEAVQRSFTARILSLKDLNYWERLKKLNLMSLQRRRERYIILHMYKLSAGLITNDLGLEFHWNIRLGLLCVVPTLRAKSKAVQTLQFHSFSSMGPMLFNRIPCIIRESTSLSAFKASLDEYLMNIPDTPPTPGYTPANSNSLLDWVNTNGRASQEVLS